jgi:hypothetical protein
VERCLCRSCEALRASRGLPLLAAPAARRCTFGNCAQPAAEGFKRCPKHRTYARDRARLAAQAIAGGGNNVRPAELAAPMKVRNAAA